MEVKRKTQIITLLVFILGIFMGAIDSGIVSPARTIIQNSFGVSDNLGIWMVTIYTLSYAVSMPIASKLSDRFGRKKVYMLSIIIFTIGSALCGINNFYGNFNLFLISRIIQAIGGGGIMPIANAYIGSSFPPEKRGTALGMIGAVYGIATILGPTLGSSILSAAGTNNWGWIFFINIPISLIILLLGVYVKDELQSETNKKMDLKGSMLVSILILSIMYALTNLNFFKFAESIQSIHVWPYLLIFVIFLPIFIIVENKADDPILNLHYFKDRQIRLTLIISFIVGAGLMGVVFVPQFAENTLRMKSGSGGYLVTFMALFSGFAAPIGGKLIDRYSAKLVMSTGFIFTITGTLFLALYVVSHPSFMGVFIGLAFIGLGMGFTMGTPLNYLMLSYVPKEESSSAISALSLIRSIGVAVSPNIMVNFISEAAKNMPNKIMGILPAVNIPSIPGVKIPPASSLMKGTSLSPALTDKFRAADVTTIVDITKEFSSSIMDKIIPSIKGTIEGSFRSGVHSSASPISIKNIDTLLSNWKNEYIATIESKRVLIENIFQSTLNQGFKHMFIAAASIAAVGLILTLLLSKEKSY